MVATALGVVIAVFQGRDHPVRQEASRPSLPPALAGMFRPTDEQWDGLQFIEAKQKPFNTLVKTDGKIVSNEDTTTPVFSPYSGRVTRLFAKEGMAVQRGEPLMAITSPEYTNAKAQLKLAITAEKRQHQLYDAKIGALKDWQQAQADLETAKGNMHAADIEREGVKKWLSKPGNKGLINGSDAVITAPITGTIIQRQVGLGQYINSASGGATTPVFSIGNLSVVWLVANVREEDAPLMQVGEPVEVHVLAYPGRTFSAKLTYVGSEIDPNTHRLPVRAEIDNTDKALKPEMYANFSIAVDKGQPSIAVPEEAVIFEGDKAHVWVAEANKQLSSRAIRVGRDSDGEVEILDGVKPGEKVLTAGSLFIDRAAKENEQDAPAQNNPAKQGVATAQ